MKNKAIFHFEIVKKLSENCRETTDIGFDLTKNWEQKNKTSKEIHATDDMVLFVVDNQSMPTANWHRIIHYW